MKRFDQTSVGFVESFGKYFAAVYTCVKRRVETEYFKNVNENQTRVGSVKRIKMSKLKFKQIKNTSTVYYPNLDQTLSPIII